MKYLKYLWFVVSYHSPFHDQDLVIPDAAFPALFPRSCRDLFSPMIPETDQYIKKGFCRILKPRIQKNFPTCVKRSCMTPESDAGMSVAGWAVLAARRPPNAGRIGTDIRSGHRVGTIHNFFLYWLVHPSIQDQDHRVQCCRKAYPACIWHEKRGGSF